MEAIFYNLTELLELSVKLLGDLDECIEMSEEIEGNTSASQVGIIFEEIAEVSANVLCTSVHGMGWGGK